MKLSTLINRIEAHTPDGYTFKASHLRDDLNLDKSATNTFQLITPNPYPTDWRKGCKPKLIGVEFWLWRKVPLKTTQTKTGGYSTLAIRQALYDDVRYTVDSINDDDYIHVREIDPVRFNDAPDGSGAGNVISCQVTMSLIVWYSPDDFDYDLDLKLT